MRRLLQTNKRLQGLLIIITALLFAGLGNFVLQWQARTYLTRTVLSVANLLDSLDFSQRSIKRLASIPNDSPFEILLFNEELKQIAGRSLSLKGQLLKDLRFAMKSHMRISNQREGYEIIPRPHIVALVRVPSGLSIKERVPGILAFFLFGLMASGILLILIRNYGQSEQCKELLGQLVEGATDDGLNELIEKVRHRLRTLDIGIRQCQKEKEGLKLQIERLKRALRKTTQDLETTQEHLLRAGTLTALGEFAAGISHELNNPMGIVLGFTQHILDDLSSDHPHYPKLKRMETELIRCQRILKDLLAFARPQEPSFRPVDVNRLVKDTVNFVFYPGVDQLDIICNLQEDLPNILVDPDQLEQILINLLKNSMDAIEGSGVITVTTGTLALTQEDIVMFNAPVIQPGSLLMDDPGINLSMRVPRVEGKAKVGDKAVKIEIKDSGCGINAKDIQKIFTPFYTTKKSGTGLGLSICWKLVRRNRGILKVKSSPGAGSTFTMIFPLHYSKESQKDET